ncbi:MOSC domain-containing protein, partial [bacterium]
MTVSGLFVYPVKSLRGIALDQAELTMKGLRWDRHWMIVDENGKFRTQRQLPHMARVSTAVNESLVLSAEGCGSVEVPFESQGQTTEVEVWNWTGPAELVDPRADRWLSEVLEMPCRLVAMLPDAHREGWGGSEIQFPDGGAILVAGEASL